MDIGATDDEFVDAMRRWRKRYDDTALMIYFRRCVQGGSIFAKPKGAGAKQKQRIASTHVCDGFRRLE